MITERQWAEAKRTTRRSIRSSMHCSVANTNRDGSPHVTPIGSLLLGSPGHGIYFDVFNAHLASNIEERPDVAILVVDSGRCLWLQSLARGDFIRPPGIRLLGRVGAQRSSTPDEVARFHRTVGPLLRTRGGAVMWKTLPLVRDVMIDRIEQLRMGSMTAGSYV